MNRQEILSKYDNEDDRLLVSRLLDKIEFVEEDKIEVVCDINTVKSVLKKLREVHPYEEPGIDIIPLINEEDLIIKN